MTHDKAMDLESFRQLLDQSGALMNNWPPEQRAEVQALLNLSAEARAELQSAADLDRAIDTMKEHALTPGLQSRILASLSAEAPNPVDRFIDWLTATLWRPAVLGLAPLLFGTWLGMAIPIEPESPASLELTTALLDEVYATYD